MASLCNRLSNGKLALRQLSGWQSWNHFKTIAALNVNSPEPSKKLTPQEIEWENAKPFDEMPGPRAIPLLGTSWTFFPIIGHGMEPSQRIEMISYNNKKYGTIWKEKLPGGITMVSTESVQDAEKIFRAESKYPERPGLDAVIAYRMDNKDKFNSPGLVTNGKSWWDVRSVAQQALLKPKITNNYTPRIGQVADDFIDRIRLIRCENNEMNDDFIDELYRWAFESIAASALNTRLGCLNPNLSPDSETMKLIDAVAIVFKTLNHLTFSLPVWKIYKTPTLRELHEVLDFLYEMSMKFINKAADDLKNRPHDSNEELNSVLEEIIMRGLPYKDAATVVMDIMLGGIDTTAHWVSYHLYLLARNPDVQEKLREEIFRVVGPARSPVTINQLNKMPYLKACAKETLRVMPVSVSNTRFTEKEMVLSGYRIPKGVMVQICETLTTVSEEQYERPKEYIPERWIKGHPMEGCPHAYSNLPFGFGKRMCLGRRLADLETWIITIKILQNFKIEYHHEDIDRISTLITKPNKPLRYQFIDL